VARPITVRPDLTPDELHKRHRAAHDPVAARQFQVVWLAASGKSSKVICEATGFSRDWVFKIIGRYNELGPEGLGDRRANNGGHGRILTEEHIAALRERLESPPDDGGLWTSPKIGAWLSDLVGREVHFKLAWVYMKRLGYSLKRPRPAHEKSDPEAREAFKKGGSEKP
jgi:transposase